MSTMNTLICQEPKKLVWKEREIPIPGEGEALIKIKSVGICGTDIHAWGGNQPFFSYPRVLGHEICGEIVGLGKNIQNLKNGQPGGGYSLRGLPAVSGMPERAHQLLREDFSDWRAPGWRFQ